MHAQFPMNTFDTNQLFLMTTEAVIDSYPMSKDWEVHFSTEIIKEWHTNPHLN